MTATRRRRPRAPRSDGPTDAVGPVAVQLGHGEVVEYHFPIEIVITAGDAPRDADREDARAFDELARRINQDA